MKSRRLRRALLSATIALCAPTTGYAATGAQDVAAQAAPRPDYADPANWAAGPAGPGAAAALPAGATPAASAPRAAVFYVHPTTYRAPGRWNQNPADREASRWTDESVIARQAGVFSACCALWAPRYRAASSNALMDDAHRDPAFALAYSDVERAFGWFVAHLRKGQPFIIAGHSQGGKHVADLLEKRIDGTPLQARMIAAYIIGINVAEGDFGGDSGARFKHVPICDKPDQTGCALQWNAMLAGSDIAARAAGYEAAFVKAHGEAAEGRRTLCINPVTFDRSRPDSLSAEAKGAVPGDPGFGPMRALRPGAVAVRCEQGMAVSYLAPGLDLKPLPGGVMHYHDIGLFYADLRANALLRTNAWWRAHR